jgi:hypothetical protein
VSAEDAAVVLKTDDIMKRFASLSKPGGAISLKMARGSTRKGVRKAV